MTGPKALNIRLRPLEMNPLGERFVPRGTVLKGVDLALLTTTNLNMFHSDFHVEPVLDPVTNALNTDHLGNRVNEVVDSFVAITGPQPKEEKPIIPFYLWADDPAAAYQYVDGASHRPNVNRTNVKTPASETVMFESVTKLLPSMIIDPASGEVTAGKNLDQILRETFLPGKNFAADRVIRLARDRAQRSNSPGFFFELGHLTKGPHKKTAFSVLTSLAQAGIQNAALELDRLYRVDRNSEALETLFEVARRLYSPPHPDLPFSFYEALSRIRGMRPRLGEIIYFALERVDGDVDKLAAELVELGVPRPGRGAAGPSRYVDAHPALYALAREGFPSAFKELHGQVTQRFGNRKLKFSLYRMLFELVYDRAAVYFETHYRTYLLGCNYPDRRPPHKSNPSSRSTRSLLSNIHGWPIDSRLRIPDNETENP